MDYETTTYKFRISREYQNDSEEKDEMKTVPSLDACSVKMMRQRHQTPPNNDSYVQMKPKYIWKSLFISLKVCLR